MDHQPIATSTSATTPAFFTNNGTPTVKRNRLSSSPVVRAMISNNRMSNCQDVTSMLKECQASGSNDRVCQVAFQYMDMCMGS